MNERFFSLPKEKQQAIMNAGYKVFSQNSYKNSSLDITLVAIGAVIGISGIILAYLKYTKKDIQ